MVLPGPGGLSVLDEASVKGRVRVRLLIRLDGTVASVEVLVSSGDSALDEAARMGLARWRFAPAGRDGVPIDAYLLLWVTFRE
jgi:protein TonB